MVTVMALCGTIKSEKTILICPTKGCNLNCNYCYVSNSTKDASLKMTSALFKTIIENILKGPHYNNLTIIWHGGEPLLAGLNFYKEVVSLEKEMEKSYNIKIHNKIQTNGTLINKDFASFFKQNSFFCCISLDGPHIVHDKNRIYYNSQGSFDKVCKGISYLKEERVPFRVLSIITKSNVNKPLELYNFFKTVAPLSVRFNDCLGSPSDPFFLKNIQISSKEFNRFLMTIFDLYVLDNDKISISPIDEIIQAIIYGKNRLCVYSQNCAGNFLSISPNGDTFYCNRLTENRFKVGNAINNSLEELVYYARKKILKENISKKCLVCLYKKICWGGCPAAYYFITAKTNNRKNPICLFKTFSHINDCLKKINI